MTFQLFFNSSGGNDQYAKKKFEQLYCVRLDELS